MRDIAASRLAGLIKNPHEFDKPHDGSPLDGLEHVSAEEVFRLLGAIPAKSSQMDFVPTAIIKRCRRVFAPLIAHLANLSFREGHFPTRFRQAVVTPLIKHDGLDPSDAASYRPISNLNTISKVIERLAQTRLRQHITQSRNFNALQSAYRRHFSTETALLCTLNDVYRSIDKGHSTLLVALDLSAAFDTVDHEVLLARLEHSFGIRGLALNWIRSYLDHRTQVVRVGSECSSVTNCDCGVPQGSVLGPLLFVAYISPIANIVTSFGTCHHQYADDTQVYIEVSRADPSVPVSKLQDCLSALHLWFSQNHLVINPDKSDAVLFSTVQQARTAPLPLDAVQVADSRVQLADSIKILGVLIDRHLSFNSHVQTTCRSANYHIRALKHIRSSLTLDMARTVASALVTSRLDYANSLLYQTSDYNITKLQRTQNALARVVFQAPRTEHIRPVLQKLHWLPIRHRIVYKIASLTHKIQSTGDPAYLQRDIRRYAPARQLRSSSSHLLSVPRTRTEIARRAFSYAAPSIWNNLPLAIRTAGSFDRFRTLLRTHLYTTAFSD